MRIVYLFAALTLSSLIIVISCNEKKSSSSGDTPALSDWDGASDYASSALRWEDVRE